MSQAETIYALASGKGRAGIAVIRVSGTGAAAAIKQLCPDFEFKPRLSQRANIIDPANSGTHAEILDEAMMVWFPGPASYTGEDVAELYVHGGRAVIEDVLGALSQCYGLRMAEPGEFTRRSFINGKLDLTAAEGVADLIDAETSAQRRQALRQVGGALEQLYEKWRKTLIATAAHLEATIDFSEEEIPQDLFDTVMDSIGHLSSELDHHLHDGRRGEILRDGFQMAIVGPPNAGKSSLLNLLARRDAAIVSSTAGTTRDVIEVHLDLGGYPVIVADTAGLRHADDEIEIEGVRRAIARAGASDLKLVVLDGSTWPDVDPVTADLIDPDSIIVLNKSDLSPALQVNDYRGQPVFCISAKTGLGIDEFLISLTATVAERTSLTSSPLITRARHRESLTHCREALGRSLEIGIMEPELIAEDLRLAMGALGRITGRVDVDDLLDVIFHDFCIGK